MERSGHMTRSANVRSSPNPVPVATQHCDPSSRDRSPEQARWWRRRRSGLQQRSFRATPHSSRAFETHELRSRFLEHSLDLVEAHVDRPTLLRGGGPVEARITSSHPSLAWWSLPCPLVRSRSKVMPLRPSSRIGTLTVVKAGSRTRVIGRSSKPAMDRSSGTRRPSFGQRADSPPPSDH